MILDIFSDRLAEQHLDNWQKDPKTRLQEYMQARRLDIPLYTLVSEEGKPHEKTFKVGCFVTPFDAPLIGIGVSRKKAEQHSAQLMLEKIEKGSK